MNMNEKTLKLLAENQHCVISTTGPDGNPQSALVGFSFNDNFEIVVGTYRQTRKYKNILKNPHISIVIASEAEKLEVQYEGEAVELESEELTKNVINYYKDEKIAHKKLHEPDRVFLKITPKWIRFVDANTHPIHFEERQFS